MKNIIFIFAFQMCFALTQSQDTVVFFMDEEFSRTNEVSAKYRREAIIHDGHFYLTDKSIEGKMVNYCEYNSIDPWIEDGWAKHYSEPGNIYAVGRYENGDMVGQWIYYNEYKSIDTVYYLIHELHSNLDSCPDYKKLKDKRKTKIEANMVVDSISNFLSDNFHISARARSEINIFFLNVYATLDSDGNIKCVEIYDPPHKDLDVEIRRILGLFHFDNEFESPLEIALKFSFNDNYNNEEAYVIVEQMPEFKCDTCKGKPKNFNEYVQNNIKVPNDSCSGRAMIQFIVEVDGNVENIIILNGIKGCQGYIEEIERVIKSAPPWIPGKQKNKPVRVKYNMGISF